MPYIKKENRDIFAPYLIGAIKIIIEEPSMARKAEMLGWWAYYLTHKLVSKEVSTKKDPDQIAQLKNQADQIYSIMTSSFSFAGIIPEDKLFALSGDLNYCISFVTWGVLDDYPGIKPASYGLRCYTSQQIRQVTDSEFLKINQRLFVIVKGVLFDVLEELYRRKTSVYEDKKILENGDLTY
jgi:hypothetical protein